MKRLAVLLSGRGSNMEAILGHTRPSGTLDGIAQIAVVAANQPEAGGLTIAAEAGIPTRVIPHRKQPRRQFERRLIAALDPFSPDLIVLAGFMRRLSPLFVSHYKNRIVNIHPADTRLHQGLDGYRWAFERGLQESFVTVHLVDEGLDTGPIIGRHPIDLTGCQSLAEVERRGLAVEHQFYSAMIRHLLEKQELSEG